MSILRKIATRKKRLKIYVRYLSEERAICYNYTINKIKKSRMDNITIYYDNQRHLVCKPYSKENLHRAAESIGIKRCWFHRNHYDIPKKMVGKLPEHCIEVQPREILNIIKGRDNV
jgi:FMN phosphatase YigB (HAD superfamily)